MIDGLKKLLKKTQIMPLVADKGDTMANWFKVKDLEDDTYIVNLDNVSYLFETQDTVKIYTIDGMSIKTSKKEAEGILNETQNQKTSRGC